LRRIVLMLTAAAIWAAVMSLGASPASAGGGGSGYDCMTNPGTDALQCHGSFGGGGSGTGGGGGIHETFTNTDYTFSGGSGGGGGGSGGGGGGHCTITFPAPIECTGRQ
jgi:hypothetical protein